MYFLPLGFAKVAEHDKKITGFMLGVVDTLWWSRDRYASDLIFYSERAGDGLRILRRFIEWANSVPRVVEITCAQSSGINVERSSLIYERAGFTKVGGLWCMSK